MAKGLIFISRCGSTLIANALRTTRQTTVISEAQPITSLFLPCVPTLCPVPKEHCPNLRRTVLQSLANIYGNYPKSPLVHLIIKFTSWNLLSISLIRSLWPTVPCVIVIRDPVEVIVSHLTKPAAWKAYKAQPLVACEIFGFTFSHRSLLAMSIEEYYARIVGRLCVAAAKVTSRDCRVCDYNDIGPRRVAQIAELFQTAACDLIKLEQVLSIYAKDKSSKLRFKDDREEKQRSATDGVKKSVERWARTPYDELRALQKW
jgi:hypothetical protein